MAISSRSYQALETLKQAGVISKVKGLVDILISPNAATGSDSKSTAWRDLLGTANPNAGDNNALVINVDSFLNEGEVITDPPNDYDIKLSDYNIIGRDLLYLDESDETSVRIVNSCISAYLYLVTSAVPKEEDLEFYRSGATNLPEGATPAQIRKEFWDSHFDTDYVIHRTFLLAVQQRLQKFVTSGEDLEELPVGEDVDNSENTIILTNQLEDVFDNIFGSTWVDYKTFAESVFYRRGMNFHSADSGYTDSFGRTFSNINISGLQSLATSGNAGKNLSVLMTKVEASGLLTLASYAYEISSFAEKRLASRSTVKKSASEFVDPNTDTVWLELLGEVVRRLKADPLTFASINYYFPSLSKFFIDALAVVGDYSNNGKGGGEEDRLNDPDFVMGTLLKAFGVNDQGEPIFEWAFKIDNTAQRIKNAINSSPYRKNIAPTNPDIFHLRLGAANFYVPPLTIDVNTSFKTGSLTGSAIRQKNSPKFNSGYRETSVRMRLFFPNYEEIWGLSISDASSINLNEDFQLDFKNGGDSEIKIDKFLSSLRGLVAAFKYSPILPVKNHYLNSVHKITGVALSNMTVSSIPNFPFALAVDIELLNFNHQPFLPMLKDFNQSIHWGKYRQYIGKAAGALHKYVNEEFLLKTSDSKYEDSNASEVLPDGVYRDGDYIITPYGATYDPISGVASDDDTYSNTSNDVLKTNIINEWRNGNNITLFAPAETQTKIFLPDTSSFRSEEEKLMTDLSQDFWSKMLSRLGIDVNESAGYGISLAETIDISKNNSYFMSDKNLLKFSIDLLTAGTNAETQAEQVFNYLATSFVNQNSNNSILKDKIDWFKNWNLPSSGEGGSDVPSKWTFQTQTIENVSLNSVKARFKDIALRPSSLLDFITEQKVDDVRRRTGLGETDPQYVEIKENAKRDVSRAFNVLVYERFFKSGPIQSLMEAARLRAGNYQFNEWEVPMLRVDLDPNAVIVNGVTVSLKNTFAKLQVQMQDEPSYQHIGGGDSYINISMRVLGEKELIKLKSLFDHVSGLARLEHATGVLGFLGMKNVITALCGIKYVLPLNYSVNTVPNYPHTYDVQLTLTDFDIFQQTREKLSSKQQKDLIENFATKKNPFLRIKQMWGSFNAYPDFPLEIRNAEGETVGHLDPDFYFRSFEMFDKDVVNSFSSQQPQVQDFEFGDGSIDYADVGLQANRVAKVLEFMRLYNSTTEYADAALRNSDNFITVSKLVEQMTEYMMAEGMSRQQFAKLLNDVSLSEKTYDESMKIKLLTDFISLSSLADENNPFLEEVNPPPFTVGDMSPNAFEQIMSIQAALEGDLSLPEEEFVSFHPDEVEFHKQIFTFPAADSDDVQSNRIPAVMQTAIGNHFGYIERGTGRFYLTVASDNVKKNAEDSKYKFSTNLVEDTQTPDRGTTNVLSGVAGATALSEYQNPYQGGVYQHWEKMMVDMSYRDLSGRMIRAFPTYMLWLIDEGGYFAGVKLFDNFYGLQSIIDFSIVSSEDLLGDTLIFRLSNLYSKLTTPESTSIFNPNIDEFNTDGLSLTEGLSTIVDRTLNISRNILSGMRNEYVVDINNIRLKPGVRVHLRVGYGSNPNSLQTVFNGIITNVEPGEIVTVTAQSDAIELGAVVNSTNKKGDSGKIDGGIDTGMYLSEPRDLMVRLLTLGSSRTREAISRATRGTVFSENRFGIRHFGMILYEPLTESESLKNEAIRNSIAGAMTIAGSNNSFMNKAVGVGQGVTFNLGSRTNTFSAMKQMWSNFSAEVDMELFKRNIYPGNGTGIAQFLGGDLDDGWSTASSLVQEDVTNTRLEGYLGRLTDYSWNQLMIDSDMGVPGASRAIEDLVEDNKLVSAQGRGSLVQGAISGALVIGGAAIGTPIIGGALIGAGLTGLISGRGGTNLFRTMGLVSANPDDDLKGFDEVSFRAQTYMRTVWDIFQTCARLLPNYIVAIRPFEDRSTVFYGKPHWIYTSGVVPVTTGYPGEEKAVELGIKPPAERSPDNDLVSILDKINKESNPYADYAAFFEAAEPNETLQQLSQDIMTSSGVFAPTSYLKGKILDFYSKPSVYFKSTFNPNTEGEIVAKIPKTKGKVNVGLHLPIGGNATEYSLASQSGIHKQINNLPPRYQFPYFTATDQLILEDSSTLESELKDTFTLETLEEINTQTEFGYNSLARLLAQELMFFRETKQTLIPSDGEIALDNPLNLYELNTAALSIPYEASTIRMPLPNISNTSGNVLPGEIDDDFSFEYQSGIYPNITYKEWGSPKTPEDEQFYIAMRWPYTPSSLTDNQSILEEFKNKYDLEELYGNVNDYKNRKVLVYNPNNNRAVVCRPAYFLWGDEDNDAVVSPDAAYYLGIIVVNQKGEDAAEYSDIIEGALGFEISGFRLVPEKQECYMAFVPDYVPVGVVAPSAAKPTSFKLEKSNPEYIDEDNQYLIGFGSFKPESGSDNLAVAVNHDINLTGSADRIEREIISKYNNSLSILQPYETELVDNLANIKYGGNVLSTESGESYFQAVLNADYDAVDRQKLYDILDAELETTGSTDSASGRASFAPVYDPADLISIEARSFYDENFDPSVSVIAGNGRTLRQAEDIWDQFRFGYHTYNSVKRIFFETFGLDPDNENDMPEFYINLLNPARNSTEGLMEKFSETSSGGRASAIDEFAILLGSDYIDKLPDTQQIGSHRTINPRSDYEKAIEFARENYIDAPLDEGGLVNYFNTVITRSLKGMSESFFNPTNLEGLLDFAIEEGSSKSVSNILVEKIKTPKQLFLLIVGIFRQRMWEDSFARAWLVLKPDRKMTGAGSEGQWSFKPVDKIFRAFINPYNSLAKPSNKDKFKQLLVATKAEGNSSTNIFAKAANGIDSFWDQTIGPVFTAIGDGLSGLLSMFKLSMQQMGYALTEAGSFKKQANILNKALNDSIYYSLGREGSLLRAVDNPFTREYGEPVIEIREPFQRIHYLSSFSHILTNQIQENINNVATVITAVSDGKYPVTVALDKGAPAERQTEKTVETGIYYDNMVGSGFLGFLHPLMHPLETFRGAAKNIQGAPDELSARRVALAHLKESIKDIYTGELMIIGNADIRPHDLVYLSDVYERMYGIFEVEQVVHHFTPDLGFVTAVTPNALVTVNDPARWFMTSWIHSWMNVQNIRNDTRIYLDRIRGSNSGINISGNISMEALSETLSPQILGGMQFTHGSSALAKDIMANETAKSLPGKTEQLLKQAGAGAGGTGNMAALVMGGLANTVPIVGQLAWKGWKWVRDNVLDQHGCYVQYLNRNGQPMDGGLSYNQGMVVGQHHSKALLPGILGVRTKVRTPEGYSYVRSDDLFKSLGWNETEIKDLVRYMSYENALTHARVLKLAGLGPERASLEPNYRVICKAVNIKDGDTVDVQDVISGAQFTVRFDGINTAETNVIEGKVDYPDTNNDSTLSFLDISTPGGQAKVFVKNKIKDKLFVVRVNPTRTGEISVITEDYEAGSTRNNDAYYQKDKFNRTIGTIFYYLPDINTDKHKSYVADFMRQNIGLAPDFDGLTDRFKETLQDNSPFKLKFKEIYDSINTTIIENYFEEVSQSDVLYVLTEEAKKIYSNLVYLKVIEEIYAITSEWPQIGWDEYYLDGQPYSLNWELVVNNLAKVYTKDILTDSQSVIGIDETAAMPVSGIPQG